MNDWKELAEKELRGGSVEEIERETLEGIRVKPLYTAEDVKSLSHMYGLPGFPPFMRGVRATMYA
ncbi:MAG: methylmalonyl-CoA mutase family protein, partial [Boseongicola sp.]|nr:methylmalonyl-CoA mutase family protein [Boseongicola sp.]